MAFLGRETSVGLGTGVEVGGKGVAVNVGKSRGAGVGKLTNVVAVLVSSNVGTSSTLTTDKQLVRVKITLTRREHVQNFIASSITWIRNLINDILTQKTFGVRESKDSNEQEEHNVKSCLAQK